MQIIKQHQNYHYYFSVEFQAGHQYLGNIFLKKKCSHNIYFNSNPKYNIRN
jgi:hypothetical protein